MSTKRILSMIMAMIMILSVLSTGVFAADNTLDKNESMTIEEVDEQVTFFGSAGDPLTGISYVDKDKVTQTCESYVAMTDTCTTWASGWYVVSGNVEVEGKVTIESNAEVHIILTDGSKLTVDGIDAAENGSLSIYGQENNTGEIKIGKYFEKSDEDMTDAYGMKIGNELAVMGGKITIEQPDITVNKEYNCYGISTKEITVYDGEVKVTNGKFTLQNCNDYNISNYGIEAQNAKIKGGTVTATGGDIDDLAGKDGDIASVGVTVYDLIVVDGGTLNCVGGDITKSAEAESSIVLNSYGAYAIKMELNQGAVTTKGGECSLTQTNPDVEKWTQSYSSGISGGEIVVKGGTLECEALSTKSSGCKNNRTVCVGIWVNDMSVLGESTVTGIAHDATLEDNASGFFKNTGIYLGNKLTQSAGKIVGTSGNAKDENAEVLHRNSSNNGIYMEKAEVTGGIMEGTAGTTTLKKGSTNNIGIYVNGHMNVGGEVSLGNIYVNRLNILGELTISDIIAEDYFLFDASGNEISVNNNDNKEFNSVSVKKKCNHEDKNGDLRCDLCGIVYSGSPVSYIDKDGATQECISYYFVKDSDEDVEWESGWYVVSGDVEIDGIANIDADEEVKLILCDESKLTLKGISGSSGALVVYGQSDGSGEMEAYGYRAESGEDVENVELEELIVAGGKIKFKESYFEDVYTYNDAKLSDMLFKGYAYWSDDEFVSSEDVDSLSYVYIKKCKHSYKNRVCQWCGAKKSGGGTPSGPATPSKSDSSSINTVTTKDEKTGTVTETTTNADGSTTIKETKKDGTVAIIEKDNDGKIITTTNYPDGTNVKTTTDKDGNTKAEVEASEDKETEINIPIDKAEDVDKIIITDEDGNKTEVTEFDKNDNGIEISVSGNCSVEVIKKDTSENSQKEFSDVHKTNHWAKDSIDYVCKKGMMNGTSDDEFEPDAMLTRGMLVTILYRAEGEPPVNKSVPFADVSADMYYANAVSWAQQNNIVSGINENEFAPDENITREQIAAIMFRYAEHKGYDVSAGENTNILSYIDYDEISEYAIEAMQYAVGSGLMTGKTESTLNPQDFATRAEIAVVLNRFFNTDK